MSTTNSSFPSSFKSNVELKHHFRFQTSAAVSTGITRANLLSLLATGTTTQQVARLMSGVKLNRVEVFGVSGGGSNDYAAATVSLEWLSNLGPTSETSDTGNALNPPHIVCTPPPQSLASFWSITGQNESEILMNITAPTGAVIDVWVSSVLFDGETPVLIATTAALYTVGQLYAGYLDGVGAAVHFVPVSYNAYS